RLKEWLLFSVATKLNNINSLNGGTKRVVNSPPVISLKQFYNNSSPVTVKTNDFHGKLIN
ncbi:unnamed protein product, partial [Heterotrigona itama]